MRIVSLYPLPPKGLRARNRPLFLCLKARKISAFRLLHMNQEGDQCDVIGHKNASDVSVE